MKLKNPRHAVYVFLLIVLGIAIPLAFVIRARLELSDTGQPNDVANAPKDQTPRPTAPKEQYISRLLYASDDEVTTVEIPNNHTLTPFLNNPTFVSGTTTAFENQAAWKLVDGTGQVISGGSMYVFSPDIGLPGPFTFRVFYDAIPKSATGTLTVYEASAKDGTPIHTVTIPVDLEQSTSTVRAFFGNASKGSSEDCPKVFGLVHTVAGPTGSKAVAMHELLKGPTEYEQGKGYSSALPEGVDQPIVRTPGGNVIRVDFDDTLERGVAGSCRVQAIRSQIEQTLKQWNEEARVTISVNGRVEDVLQP